MKRPLPPPHYDPCVKPVVFESEDEAALRTARNARRRDKKAGKSPRKWP